jgi:CRP-like cAMP-binding protein
VVAMEDGKTAEAGVVGKEGFTGIAAAVGISRSPLQTVVQIRGDGFRTQDRVDSESLPITHDFLATMLGTNRSSVSLAAGNLQRKKIIEYTYGAVTIVNRKRLEDFACECYGIMQQYNGQLGLK